MTVHFGIFPSDFVQSLSVALEEESNVRYLRLPHPRTGIPSLFLPYNDNGGGSKLLEIQAVSTANPRSWFMEDEVVADGKFLVVTPMDPVFLLIPLLQTVQQNGMPGSFRPVDDIIEDIASSMKDAMLSQDDGECSSSAAVTADDALLFLSLDCTRKALKRVCDTKDISPELSVFRYSTIKTLEYLQRKISRLSSPDILNGSRTITRNFAKDGLMDDGKEKLLSLGYTKAACDLIQQYISPEMHKTLLASYNLQDLDSHLRQNVAQAVSSSANSAPIKGKGKTAVSIPNEKKRKNAKGSHGVEKLKKANVSGMAKLSSFFKKPEVS